MPIPAAQANGRQPVPSDAQADRMAELMRAYQRQLGRRPTTIQRTLRDRAAHLTAIAEFAARDPRVSLDDVVRLDHSAARARAEFAAAITRTTEEMPFLAALLTGG